MSIRIIKAGILDTVQDPGRYGFQNLGINPGGVMDRFSSQVVNGLVGNDESDALIEMHFPAAAILFNQDTMVAVGGADFTPAINNEKIPLWHPILVSNTSVLQFQNSIYGARCYLAIKGGLRITKWLNSSSTNLKAEAGGFRGRKLQKGDLIHLQQMDYSKYLVEKDFVVLPWKADIKWNKSRNNEIQVLPGNEWERLTDEAKEIFGSQLFSITTSSDRMGYRMNGPSLQTLEKKELLSSAVSFGTIQLLPDGQMIILMADHQTTGGYPRVAHVITPDLSKLAQMNPGDKINFTITDQKKAEDLLIKEQHHLVQLRNACKFRLKDLFL